MTDDEFKDICSMIHAFRGVARQTENAALDLPEGTYMPLDERVRVLGAKLLSYKARNGMQIRDVLSYLLYGGPNDGIVDRIWNVAFEPDYHIDRFGLSCVGETVGWALPDLFPPRNGRTSKALFALGNDVTIHTV